MKRRLVKVKNYCSNLTSRLLVLLLFHINFVKLVKYSFPSPSVWCRGVNKLKKKRIKLDAPFNQLSSGMGWPRAAHSILTDEYSFADIVSSVPLRTISGGTGNDDHVEDTEKQTGKVYSENWLTQYIQSVFLVVWPADIGGGTYVRAYVGIVRIVDGKHSATTVDLVFALVCDVGGYWPEIFRPLKWQLQ